MLLLLVLFEQSCPLLLVRFQVEDQALQVWECFHDLRVGWLYDEVDETDLTLCDVCRFSFEELADLESILFFQIALHEELYEEQVRPQAAQVPGLRWVRDIGKMEHELDEELFVLSISWIEIFIGCARADLSKLHKVLGHVCCQHSLDYDMASTFIVLCGHVNRPVTLGVLFHDLERRSQVMVLQHASIVVPDCLFIIHIDKEDGVDTRMVVIVQGSGYQAACLLQVVKLKEVFQATFDREVVESLADISRVRLVVISDALVSHCQSLYEVDEIVEVKPVVSNEVMSRQDKRKHCLQLVTSCQLTKLEDVEVNSVNLLKLKSSFRCQLEELGDQCYSHSLSDLVSDCLLHVLLGIKDGAIMLERTLRLVSKLVVPSLHNVLHILRLFLRGITLSNIGVATAFRSPVRL